MPILVIAILAGLLAGPLAAQAGTQIPGARVRFLYVSERSHWNYRLLDRIVRDTVVLQASATEPTLTVTADRLGKLQLDDGLTSGGKRTARLGAGIGLVVGALGVGLLSAGGEVDFPIGKMALGGAAGIGVGGLLGWLAGKGTQTTRWIDLDIERMRAAAVRGPS